VVEAPTSRTSPFRDFNPPVNTIAFCGFYRKESTTLPGRKVAEAGSNDFKRFVTEKVISMPDNGSRVELGSGVTSSMLELRAVGRAIASESEV